MLGPLCIQTVNLKTDSKTLYLQFTEIKYTPNSVVKHNLQKTKRNNVSLKSIIGYITNSQWPAIQLA